MYPHNNQPTAAALVVTLFLPLFSLVLLTLACGQKTDDQNATEKQDKAGAEAQEQSSPKPAPATGAGQARPTAPTRTPGVSGERLGLGTPVGPEVYAAWDIDVMPDGRGLPPGSGTAKKGAKLYKKYCVACHGATGKEGPMDKLVGGIGSLATASPLQTVGSYWPYATTLFDYLRRSMPMQAPQTLSNDEIYSLTGYVLFLNEIVGEDEVMNSTSVAAVKMPNRNGFITADSRPDTANDACMNDC
ncbi:MAG: c-type cytochrome [Proteobacteria bacterium]|nr:c-type cytochrome [Pseudomonadota bacterium]